ncbi:MAG: ThaI family type II restriction endonuclease [Ignavibacteria bacterium]|nr:ThaI family type II restriction endonuclease [Ignavibacteria bacterium]
MNEEKMLERTNYINKIFDDIAIVQRIQSKLPRLFQMANIESSRAGKVGMEVGVLREKIIVALFLYVFGEECYE